MMGGMIAIGRVATAARSNWAPWRIVLLVMMLAEPTMPRPNVWIQAVSLNAIRVGVTATAILRMGVRSLWDHKLIVLDVGKGAAPDIRVWGWKSVANKCHVTQPAHWGLNASTAFVGERVCTVPVLPVWTGYVAWGPWSPGFVLRALAMRMCLRDWVATAAWPIALVNSVVC